MPATIEEHDSEVETCAPDSIGDNLAYQECEDSADEEFFDCSEVAFPSVGTLFCDEKFNEQCARFGLDRGVAFDLRCGYDLNKSPTRDAARTRAVFYVVKRQIRLHATAIIRPAFVTTTKPALLSLGGADNF